MSRWLDPVRRSLDSRTTPVAVFYRNDDAGWDDDGLARLLDVFAESAVPLDLAVIPAELTDVRAAWLCDRRRAHTARLGLHQHGWAHENHEPIGRKCEFGPARPLDWLVADVARGQQVMADAFGDAFDSVFTPPWNRCVAALGPRLVERGLTTLSRDVTADLLNTPGLRECATHVDWSSRTRGVSMGLGALAVRCASVLAACEAVGLLFHHAVMDESDRVRTRELLAVLSGHPAARCMPLLEAAAWSAARPVHVARHIGEAAP